MLKIIKKQISQRELKKAAQESFGEMVKAVVDIEKEIMSLGGELHADGEALLLKGDSKQDNLWGINIYPDKPLKNQIEFSALINIRPATGNKAMEIQNPKIKEKINKIVSKLIK